MLWQIVCDTGLESGLGLVLCLFASTIVLSLLMVYFSFYQMRYGHLVLHFGVLSSTSLYWILWAHLTYFISEHSMYVSRSHTIHYVRLLVHFGVLSIPALTAYCNTMKMNLIKYMGSSSFVVPFITSVQEL